MMDRLQKKCFIATAALHGLLVGVLLFGAALMPERHDENNAKLFTAYDASKVSDALSQGGEPDVKVSVAQPAAEQPQPQPSKPATEPVQPKPTPEPPKVHKQEPPPEPEKVRPPKVTHEVHNDIPDIKPEKTIEKNPRLNPDDLKPVQPKTTHKPTHKPRLDPSELKETTSHSDEGEKVAREAAAAEAKAKQRATARAFASALRSLNKGLSSETPLVIGITPGAGGGGADSVNFGDLITSKYYNAWNPPGLLGDDTSPVEATVTIGRDGNVISAHVTKSSGNPVMDKSVERVLELVSFFEPFPERAKESQRTYIVQFNLSAKRQIG